MILGSAYLFFWSATSQTFVQLYLQIGPGTYPLLV